MPLDLYNVLELLELANELRRVHEFCALGVRCVDAIDLVWRVESDVLGLCKHVCTSLLSNLQAPLAVFVADILKCIRSGKTKVLYNESVFGLSSVVQHKADETEADVRLWRKFRLISDWKRCEFITSTGSRLESGHYGYVTNFPSA